MDYEIKRRIERVKKALQRGDVTSIEFSKDGSCVTFNFYDPAGDHGCPCTMMSSLRTEYALQAVAGFRLKQHELKNCF